MRVADNRALHHAGVHVDRVLHFGGSDAVAADVEHIVHTTRDPVVSIGVAVAAVAGEVQVLVGREVIRTTSLVVTVGGSDHARPWKSYTEVSIDIVAGDLFSLFINQHRLNTGQGSVACAGFAGVTPAMLEIMTPPVSVCHQVSTIGHFSFPHVLVVPVPGFFVDRFANRTEYAQAVEVLTLQRPGVRIHE